MTRIRALLGGKASLEALRTSRQRISQSGGALAGVACFESLSRAASPLRARAVTRQAPPLVGLPAAGIKVLALLIIGADTLLRGRFCLAGSAGCYRVCTWPWRKRSSFRRGVKAFQASPPKRSKKCGCRRPLMCRRTAVIHGRRTSLKGRLATGFCAASPPRGVRLPCCPFVQLNRLLPGYLGILLMHASPLPRLLCQMTFNWDCQGSW